MANRLVRVLAILLSTGTVMGTALTDIGDGRTREQEPVETNATFYNDASLPGADPFVLHDPASGHYFAYSTKGAEPGYHFAIYRSPDLATWQRLPGGALPARPDHWARDWFWAPEVYHNPKTGLYYLFYSGRMGRNVAEHFQYADFEEPSKIGVAVADSPAGPFRDIANHPIDYRPYDPDYHDVNLIMDETQKKPPETLEEGMRAPLGVYLPSIDPNVFFDEGRIFLYYSRNAYRNWVWDRELGKYIEESNIYAVELTADWWNDPTGSTMPAIHPRYRNANRAPSDSPDVRKDGFTPILDYGSDPQKWENAHVNDYAETNGELKDRRWEEGSTTIKTYRPDGRPLYFLTYSANNYESPSYGVGYAVADNPLGPWRKSSANPVLAQDKRIGMFSTGHGSPALSPDGSQLYYVHHGRPNTDTHRRLYTARMGIDPNTESLTIGQTVRDQPIPSGVAPYTLDTGTRLVSLRGGAGKLEWSVSSAAGASHPLGHPLNRVALSLRHADGVRVEKHPGHAVLTGEPADVGAVVLRYQRRSARGEFFGVANILGAGTGDEQHRPVERTIPVTGCTNTVTGHHQGDLVVREGVVCVRDATVHGDIRVRDGASVVVVDSTVRGSVDAADAGNVWLLGGRVERDVAIRGAIRIVRVDEVTVTGQVTLADNTGPRPVLADSTVEGTVSCRGNRLAPTDEQRANRLHGPASGQCAGM